MKENNVSSKVSKASALLGRSNELEGSNLSMLDIDSIFDVDVSNLDYHISEKHVYNYGSDSSTTQRCKDEFGRGTTSSQKIELVNSSGNVIFETKSDALVYDSNAQRTNMIDIPGTTKKISEDKVYHTHMMHTVKDGKSEDRYQGLNVKAQSKYSGMPLKQESKTNDQLKTITNPWEANSQESVVIKKQVEDHKRYLTEKEAERSEHKINNPDRYTNENAKMLESIFKQNSKVENLEDTILRDIQKAKFEAAQERKERAECLKQEREEQRAREEAENLKKSCSWWYHGRCLKDNDSCYGCSDYDSCAHNCSNCSFFAAESGSNRRGDSWYGICNAYEGNPIRRDPSSHTCKAWQ